MTPEILLDQLKLFIEAKTAGIMLPVKTAPNAPPIERAAEVWPMRLPTKEHETKSIPYIILQLVNGTDEKDEYGADVSGCFVRLVFGVYSEDASKGGLWLLNLMMTVRTALLKQQLIGGQFVLEPPVEWLIYPDNTAPYFFGEMATNWTLPTIEREVLT